MRISTSGASLGKAKLSRAALSQKSSTKCGLPERSRYSVSITGRAERDIRKLDKQIKSRITKTILALADDPRPAGCLKVQGEEDVWRIRVGDWRVGYLVDDAAKEVVVVRIAHRSEFYS